MNVVDSMTMGTLGIYLSDMILLVVLETISQLLAGIRINNTWTHKPYLGQLKSRSSNSLCIDLLDQMK